MQIISNGSKWSGEAPDPIETLLEVLATEILDPTFELHSGFIHKEGSMTRAFGNFRHVSHVFNVVGTTAEMAPIVAAIDKAMQNPDYLRCVTFRIDDVMVLKGEPKDGNPNLHFGLAGVERETALYAFRKFQPTCDYTFWYVPRNKSRPQQAMIRITNRDHIMWPESNTNFGKGPA